MSNGVEWNFVVSEKFVEVLYDWFKDDVSYIREGLDYVVGDIGEKYLVGLGDEVVVYLGDVEVEDDEEEVVFVLIFGL